MARNVAVYETYQPQGIFYFGSDKASPVDTGYPYSNLLTGGFFAYGEDNKRQINHARYNQVEWFVQDSWKIGRRLTIDYGARFYGVGPLYSVGATLGLFDGASYDKSKSGQLLFPAMVNGAKASVNPATGAVYPYVRQGTFDTASYASGGIPFSGIKQYKDQLLQHPAHPDRAALRLRLGCFREGQDGPARRFRHRLRPPLERGHDRRRHRRQRPHGRPAEPAQPRSSSTLPSPILANAQAVYTPQNVLTGSQDFRPPATL